MATKHLIDLESFSHEELYKILNMARMIMKNPTYYNNSCHGKIMATLFYEPSTRTQMSFQTAMLRLGGSVIGFDNPMNSSVSKGESLKDTVKVISNYADIITIRHFDEGSAKAASLFSKSPIINAGDGGHLHPTQTLTDVLTLLETKGRLENLTLGLCGDLKNGRTVHSFIKTMSHFKNNKFVLICTKELTVPDYIKKIMKSAGCEFTESASLKESIAELDVLYMTRIQKERFASEEEYINQKGVFVLDMEKLNIAKSDLRILHPLPRVDEIDIAVDDDKRAVYFQQTEFGMYARMALIVYILDKDKHSLDEIPTSSEDFKCKNPRCITLRELYLPKLVKNVENQLICEFCEQ